MSGLTPDEEKSLFYQGYGQTKINQDAMAYYRFERIIQDIGDYCEYIFLSDEGGDDRMQCFEYLKSNFYQAVRLKEPIRGFRNDNKARHN